MRKWAIPMLLVLVVAVSACGGKTQPLAGAGDATAGEVVFNAVAAPPCSSCHSLEAGKTMVGPSLAGIGNRSEADIRKAVVSPNDTIAQGFAANVMPKDYAKKLSEQQLNDLIAYLMAQK